jgi:hypothetical protein
MDSYMASNGSCFMVTWTFWKPPLGGMPNTKPSTHGTPNTHNHWFILLNHVWSPAWIECHWNSIRLRAWSHMTSHYAWGFVTTLHEFGGVLGRPFDTFFWALTITWSRNLACVWSGPCMGYETGCNWEGQQTDFLWPRSKAASEILWCVTPKFLHAIIGIVFVHIWFEGMIWGMFVAAKSWEIYY